MQKLSAINSEAFLLGTVILLTFVCSINAAAVEGMEVVAEQESNKLPNKFRVCTPDLACISPAALPRWRQLAKNMLQPISISAKQERESTTRVNPKVTMWIAGLIETYLQVYKDDEDISCALEADCLTILEILAINLNNHAHSNPNCNLVTDPEKICVSDNEANVWLEEIQNTVGFLISV